MDFVISKYLFKYVLDNELVEFDNDIHNKHVQLKKINYKRIDFYDCCVFGNLSIIKLLFQNDVDPSCALRCCCDGNQLEIAQWLNKQIKFTGEHGKTNNNYCLHTSCVNGHLDFAKWLAKRFSLTRIDATDRSTLSESCLAGRLEVVKWLIGRFRLSWSLIGFDTLEHCCRIGHFDLVEYLIKYYNLDRTIVKPIRILKTCCKHGQLKSVKWLVKYFHLTQQDIGNGINQAFYISCHYNHLTVAQYLFDNFKICKEDVANRYIFYFACEQGYLEVAKWLHENFKDKLDADLLIPETFETCYKDGHIEVAHWLNETFNLNRDGTCIEVLNRKTWEFEIQEINLKEKKLWPKN